VKVDQKIFNPPEALERISVRLAYDEDAGRWSDYVRDHPRSTVFHRWEWRTILARSFRHTPYFLIAERAGTIVGILPLAHVKSRLFGNALVSLPFCSYAGPIGSDAAVLGALNRYAVEFGSLLQTRRVEIRRTEPSGLGWPTQDLYVYFTKSISDNHDINMQAIPRKQRAMVRKGIKNGLISTIGDTSSFFPLYVDNSHRHGSPGCSVRFFEEVSRTFGSDCEILIVRTLAGEAVSGVLSLFHRDEVFPLYAGDTPVARDLAANDFKYWEVMRRGAERGARNFNFGRSKRGTGSFDFKTNWGFDPSPLSYEFHLHAGEGIPQHNPLNPKYRLAIQAWQRMPRWFVLAAGPLLIGGLG
jgi:FemAB-related protein (PEP-CTERM system-associated)